MAYQVSIVKVDCNEKQPKNVSFEGEEARIEEQPRGEGNGETSPVSNDNILFFASEIISNMS